MSSSEEDVDDERDSHDSEKADSRESHDSSPIPFFKLKKGGGLFRGTKQEKVCQICEKPGDTVKCRGPCCATLHLECVSKSLAAKDNINATTPMNIRVKNKTDGDDNDASVEMKERDDRGVHELTNSSKTEDKPSKPVNCNLIGHNDMLDEKADKQVSRKRKRIASEEEILVTNKKNAKQGAVRKNDRGEESKENETGNKEIPEKKEDDHVGVNKKREGCRQNVEINKEAEISPEVRDKDERKERVVMKRKDKEERGKDDVTEDKTVTDAAGEFRCQDCKEGRNPPCFACGRIQEEKTGRGHRQRCAVGKHL